MLKYRIDMKNGYGFQVESEDKDLLCKISDKADRGGKIIMISDELIINVDELASIVRV